MQKWQKNVISLGFGLIKQTVKYITLDFEKLGLTYLTIF